MSRIVIDIDDDVLTEAMKEYDTRIKEEAVNRALQEVAERRAEKLRRASEVWDRMADDMADTDWDETWRRSR
jgi:Arc/MetJ family transcription regulator